MLYLIPLVLLPFVYAQEIPDYNNPYAPIFFDKEIYTWTDKVNITIIAPSWNTNPNLIDTLGGNEDNPIKVSTRTHSLEPYRFSETDPKSGVFLGEIILTGFSHDTDGDGKSDLNPRTFGNGPTNGFLETERESAITVSFEFADGVVLTKTVPISWNIGTIQLKETNHENEFSIQVVDFDLNLNPEGIDHIPAKIYSDSDVAGIEVDVIETREDSGIFFGTISISNFQDSSGNRLYAIPGDTIHARYTDYTLPRPYSISDSIEVEDIKLLESLTPNTQRVLNEKFLVTDSFGNELTSISSGSQIQLVGNVLNDQPFVQKFTYLFQVKNESDSVISLSWVQGEISPGQSLDVSQSWFPHTAGIFSIETFVWKSLSDPLPLSPPLTSKITVN